MKITSFCGEIYGLNTNKQRLIVHHFGRNKGVNVV